jgi:hypothetical protein
MKILSDYFIQPRSKPETNAAHSAPPQESPAQHTSYKPTPPIFTGPTKDLDQIVHTVAAYYRLKPQDLKLRRRTHQIVLPRQVAMYLIRKRTKIGFVEIGKYFGKKDHTTVMHAIKKIDVQLRENSKVSEAICEIEALFQH